MRGPRLFKANQRVNSFLKHKVPWWRQYSLLGSLRKTRVPCSCWMCCNPRRVYGNGRLGKRMQEIKQNIAFEEQSNEI